MFFPLLIGFVGGVYLFNESRSLCRTRHALFAAAIPVAVAVVSPFLALLTGFSFHLDLGPTRFELVPPAITVVAFVLARRLAARYMEQAADDIAVRGEHRRRASESA